MSHDVDNWEIFVIYLNRYCLILLNSPVGEMEPQQQQ